MRSFSFIATSFIAVAALLTSVPLAAQDNPRDYTGGPRYGAPDSYPEDMLTPRLDLSLQSVEVEVPAQFRDQVPEGLTVNVPPGFKVSVFAAGPIFNKPRLMAFDDNGVLHVGNMRRGQIVALPDRDGDGIADEQIVSLTGFVEGHSLAFYKGDLYVGDENRIERARDNDGDLVYEQREHFITGIPWEGWHDTRTIVFDEINEKLYVSVGSACDLCREEPGLQVVGNTNQQVSFSPERGTILEFNADGTGRRIFATGVRNVIGMAMHPVSNELWANNNGHNQEGRFAPPEWIDIVRDNDFMGSPFVHGYRVWNNFQIPEYEGILPITQADSLLVATQKPPVGLVPAHYAPMGIHFYTGDQFPSAYHNAAFVAFHAGAAKKSSDPGYNVSVLFSDPDGSNARIAEFMNGFQKGTTQQSVWGFPVGLITDADGSLYITSDKRTELILKVTHSELGGFLKTNLPPSVVLASPVHVLATLRVDRLGEGGGDPRVTADLSGLGGPAEVVLVNEGDGTFTLDVSLVAATLGPHDLLVRVEQDLGDGTEVLRFTRTIDVLPPPWSHDLPHALARGDVDLQATVHIGALSPEGPAPRVTADLSALGGPTSLLLTPAGDDAYDLDVRLDLADFPFGEHLISVLLQQEVGGKLYGVTFQHVLSIVPRDLSILNDGLTNGWQITADRGAQVLGPTADGPVFHGQTATAVHTKLNGLLDKWRLEVSTPAMVDRFGFVGVRFAFHRGTIEKPIVNVLNLYVGEGAVDLVRASPSYGVDFDLDEWQIIEIPFEAFVPVPDDVSSIRLEGSQRGTFYIDDVRLVTAIPAAPPFLVATAVTEDFQAQPDDFALDQNYPNPFNSETVIRYRLPRETTVDLVVFDMVGQEVARLVYGRRAAGIHTVTWDGRDDADRKLATGMYIYRLKAGDQTSSRKLLLLR
jgi:glucose/arabinose dehydrogenase